MTLHKCQQMQAKKAAAAAAAEFFIATLFMLQSNDCAIGTYGNAYEENASYL